MLDGGVGTADTASYATAGSGVTVSLAIAGPQDTMGAGVDTLIGIERLIGSSGNDTLTGDGLANRITAAPAMTRSMGGWQRYGSHFAPPKHGLLRVGVSHSR
jgi:hypothetical protein